MMSLVGGGLFDMAETVCFPSALYHGLPIDMRQIFVAIHRTISPRWSPMVRGWMTSPRHDWGPLQNEVVSALLNGVMVSWFVGMETKEACAAALQ